MRWRLRERLKHRDGSVRRTLDDIGPRPRHMKRSAWAEIVARDQQLAERWHDGICRKFGVTSVF